MDDIPSLLRSAASTNAGDDYPRGLMERGAAEIERLRAALESISVYGGVDKPDGSKIHLSAASALQMRAMARAALRD